MNMTLWKWNDAAGAFDSGATRMSMPRRRAFTLIELLVVVAIISLLVSILLPSLNQAKNIAKSVICKSNMRNIGMGVQTYAYENNVYLPPTSGQNPAVANCYWYWADFVAPYCDDSTLRSQIPGSTSVGSQPKDNNYEKGWIRYSRMWDCPALDNIGSYEFLWNGLFSWTISTPETNRKKLSSIRKPADLSQFVCGRGYNNSSSVTLFYDVFANCLGASVPHPGNTSNIWFHDGHVGVITDEEILGYPQDYKNGDYLPFSNN